MASKKRIIAIKNKIYNAYQMGGTVGGFDEAGKHDIVITEYCNACDMEAPVIEGEHECIFCGQETELNPILNKLNEIGDKMKRIIDKLTFPDKITYWEIKESGKIRLTEVKTGDQLQEVVRRYNEYPDLKEMYEAAQGMDVIYNRKIKSLEEQNKIMLEALQEAGYRIAYCMELNELSEDATAMLKGEIDAINVAIQSTNRK